MEKNKQKEGMKKGIMQIVRVTEAFELGYKKGREDALKELDDTV